MNAQAVPILAIFEKKLRLEVPLFQRQYVWSEEAQWEPLWEDISRKFCELLEGRTDAPVHFLGAVVLDQKQTPTTHVERRQIIDGQQRLATLQIFLAAFRDFCRERDRCDIADECDSYILNKGMMTDASVDRFKVWPTQLDRPQFQDVVTAGSRSGLEAQYPLIRRKYARRPDPRPRMVEAYLFFNAQLREFFDGSNGEPPLFVEAPIASRLEQCFTALKSALQVVVIDLAGDDDAQVIFETLNARGEPLLPADLLKNFIFLRATRQNEDPDALYHEFWKRFDDPFWRQEIRQGRLSRPRSDLFLQHFLTSRRTFEIPIKHLYVEYKNWINSDRPFATVRDELQTITRQGDDFRQLIDPKPDDPLYALASFLNCFDISTAFPLILFLLNAQQSEDEWSLIAVTLQSYILRRAVCGLTAKNYNQVFLRLTRFLQKSGISADRLHTYLADELSGSSSAWPRDDQFKASWLSTHAYQTMQRPKVVHVLKRLNGLYLSEKSEDITIHNPLTVEHMMPQEWVANWPLADGSAGIPHWQLWSADQAAERTTASVRRNASLQTFGNLTLLTQPLNSAVSNGGWHDKKNAILASSLLPINQQLRAIDVWDEQAILERGERLFEKALQLWPSPDA